MSVYETTHEQVSRCSSSLPFASFTPATPEQQFFAAIHRNQAAHPRGGPLRAVSRRMCQRLFSDFPVARGSQSDIVPSPSN
jgi:hypothetical protein